MRVLLTNDDGFYAEGIKTIARELAKLHELTVVAPDTERSGSGGAMTLNLPLRAAPAGYEDIAADVYFVNGTPVDCCKLGIHLMGGAPDLIVSGINKGPNLGTDVLCSGTASAALDAALNGYQAIALSCASYAPKHFETAALIGMRVIEYANRHPIPFHTMLNVNVPDLPVDQIRGIKPARLSFQKYEQIFDEYTGPRGDKYFWLSGTSVGHSSNDGDTDDFWVRQGYVTITPVQCDLTNREYIMQMQKHEIIEGAK